MPRGPIRLWFLPLLASLVGCGPQGGGQSGGEGSFACERVQQPFEMAERDGVRVATVARTQLALLQKDLYLTWWPRSGAWIPSTRVELSAVELAESATVGCGGYSVEVEFHLSADAGGLDADFAGTLRGTGSEASLTARLVAGGVSQEVVRADLPSEPELALELSLEEDWIAGVLRSTSDLSVVAKLKNQDAPQHPGAAPGARAMTDADASTSLSAVQLAACSARQPTTLRAFASDAQLVATVAKRWVVCSTRGNWSYDFAGLVIDGTGHYHELTVVDEQLVARRGLGHEGAIVSRAASGLTGSLLLWLGGSLERMALSVDGNTLDVTASTLFARYDVTFQATDFPVRYPPLPFAQDSSVGRDGCMGGEADVLPVAASLSELRARLLGRWLFCSGRFGQSREYGGVEFRAEGGFHWLDEHGAPLPMGGGSYEIVDTSWSDVPAGFQVNVFAPRGNVGFREPSISRTPIKMEIRDAFGTVLSKL